MSERAAFSPNAVDRAIAQEEDDELSEVAYQRGFDDGVKSDEEYPFYGQNPYDEGSGLVFLWDVGWLDGWQSKHE